VPVGWCRGLIIAIPVGLVALRVRRHTFVVITIAIFFVFQLSAINFSFTGGTAGSPTAVDPVVHYETNTTCPSTTQRSESSSSRRCSPRWCGVRRFGLQLLAIRDDEDRAAGLGVKVFAVKLTGFALSAFAVGMGGALYAMFIGQIYPQFVFDPDL
jgi:branched-chain amino acid transport system permease protein